MRRRFLLQIALAAAFPWVGTSCLSPTLPLPPPETEFITESEEGFWTISGTCESGALVTVFNETQHQGVVVEDRDRRGKFVVKLKADLCDVGWASQVVGSDSSSRTSFVVKPKSPNDASLNVSCVGADDAASSEAPGSVKEPMLAPPAGPQRRKSPPDF